MTCGNISTRRTGTLTLVALGLSTCEPWVTWPSPTTATLPFFRTDRMVVP